MDVPLPLAHGIQAELVGDLSGTHRIGEVLLVREDEEARVPQLILSQHLLQLVLRLPCAVAVVGLLHH